MNFNKSKLFNFLTWCVFVWVLSFASINAYSATDDYTAPSLDEKKQCLSSSSNYIRAYVKQNSASANELENYLIDEIAKISGKKVDKNPTDSEMLDCIYYGRSEIAKIFAKSLIKKEGGKYDTSYLEDNPYNNELKALSYDIEMAIQDVLTEEDETTEEKKALNNHIIHWMEKNDINPKGTLYSCKKANVNEDDPAAKSGEYYSFKKKDEDKNIDKLNDVIVDWLNDNGVSDFLNDNGIKNPCKKTIQGKANEDTQSFLDSLCENGAQNILLTDTNGSEEIARVCKNAPGITYTPQNDTTEDNTEEDNNPTREEIESCIVNAGEESKKIVANLISSGGDLTEVIALANEIKNYVDDKSSFSEDALNKLNNKIIDWMNQNEINHSCKKTNESEGDTGQNDSTEEDKNPTPPEMASCILGIKEEISNVVNNQFLNGEYNQPEFRLATRIMNYSSKKSFTLEELKKLNNDIIDWMDKNNIIHSCEKSEITNEDKDKDITIGCKYGTRNVEKFLNGKTVTVKVCKSDPNANDDDPGICLDG